MTRANPDFEMAQRHLKEADIGEKSEEFGVAVQDVTLNPGPEPNLGARVFHFGLS